VRACVLHISSTPRPFLSHSSPKPISAPSADLVGSSLQMGLASLVPLMRPRGPCLSARIRAASRTRCESTMSPFQALPLSYPLFLSPSLRFRCASESVIIALPQQNELVPMFERMLQALVDLLPKEFHSSQLRWPCCLHRGIPITLLKLEVTRRLYFDQC